MEIIYKKEDIMKIGINVMPLHTGHSLRGIGYYTNNLLNYLKAEEDIEILEFIKLSEAKDAQLIHYPWFDFYFHTLPLTRPYPTIVTVHDVIPLLFAKKYPVGMRGRLNFFLQKRALNSCKFIITDSEVSKKDIIEQLNINQEKIEVIPLAADPKFKILKDTDLLRIKLKYKLPDRFIMYTGDANWSKNLPFLIEGYKQTIRLPQFKDVKLALIGGVFLKNVENINHPELDSLKKLNRIIKENRLENYIIRPGNLEDNELVTFYNLATLYIQPSLYEGFGLPVLQAFACGAPVISSNAGSLPEVGGRAAIYFDPIDIRKFVSLLSEVLQNKSLRYKLSKLGLVQVNKFSWKKTTAQTIEVYKRVMRNINV